MNHTEIVKIGNVTSQPMIVTTRLKQGDTFSPVMLNWY